MGAGWDGAKTLLAVGAIALMLYVAIGLTRMQEEVDLRLSATHDSVQALVGHLRDRVDELEGEVREMRIALRERPPPPPPPWVIPDPSPPPPPPRPPHPPHPHPPPSPPPMAEGAEVWLIRVTAMLLLLIGGVLVALIRRTWVSISTGEESEGGDVEAAAPEELAPDPSPKPFSAERSRRSPERSRRSRSRSPERDRSRRSEQDGSAPLLTESGERSRRR